MAITITKVKSVKKPVEKVDEPEVKLLDKMSDEELADLYGDLNARVEELKKSPIFTKFAKVQNELKNRLKEEMQAEDSGVLEGARWALDIGPCAKNNRALKSGAISKIRQFVGDTAFNSIAKVTIGDCDKYLAPSQLEEVIDSDVGYSDKRAIKVSPLV